MSAEGLKHMERGSEEQHRAALARMDALAQQLRAARASRDAADAEAEEQRCRMRMEVGP